MQRRRKKRCPIWRGGIRNVEIQRSGIGYGLTISGQRPCIVSAIAPNSPADLAGVRAGDFLISINGLNVSKLQHEVIVKLINDANLKIWMSIADNYYKSDSSDDDEPCNLSGVGSSGGRSLVGADGSQRMRSKYSAKGLRFTPQQSPQRMPLSHASSYEVLVPSSRSSRHRLQYGHPGHSSSTHDLPFNAPPPDYYFASAASDGGGGAGGGADRQDNSVLIEVGQRECVPSLEYKIIVGYLGTIEMPGQLNGPRLQIVRQCIKKMRQEKRQPVAVLMTILPHCMTLRNASHQVLATYAASRMSYVSNGRESETERSQTNFGLITTAYYDANGIMVSPNRTPDGAVLRGDMVVSNSCHVFMVNQKIVDHRVHFEKLSLFKIRCTRDPISNLCLEFPNDTDYVVNLIRSMYTLNVNEGRSLRNATRSRAVGAAAVDDRNDMAVMSNSPQPSNHSELTTTSSNSDSGIGFNNDCSNICDRILVVNFPGLRERGNNYPWQNNNNNGVAVQNRPSAISTDRDLCPIDGGNPQNEVVEAESEQERKCPSVDLSLQSNEPENKLTVRAMPFPKKSVDGAAGKRDDLGYEERAVDVPSETTLHSSSEVLVDLQQNQNRDEFVFRAPTVPSSGTKGKSARQRLNFFNTKLSPKVFGQHRNRPVSQSCENISTTKSGGRRQLIVSEEVDKVAMDSRDEYIDIWGSVSEVNEKDCARLYTEINAQRSNLLDGASSEPNINAMAKSLADDLIENCGNFSRSTRNSPFRRYGQISSSFRSQLTATEAAKKMLHNGGTQMNAISLPSRPRSFASSEGDVYDKSNKPPEAPPMKAGGKPRDESKKNTRVLDWNTSFERLLGDICGVHAFAEFLRKEFSAENIYFWTACERYKQLDSDKDRYQEAQNIFQRHLESGAPEPVNIDSRATSKTLEQLKSAKSDLFEAAQKQIFNLMKFDSYARFIKSDIYKNCLDCEMKKFPLPYPENGVLDPALCINLAVQPAASVSPVKLKKSLSNAEDRRRKSLLPWHRKTRSKSKDRNEKESDPSNNIYSSRSSLSSFDAVLSAAESTENQRSQLCRVILPNGATTIVQTRSTETIRELVERLLEKRGLAYTCFEVFVSGSNKACDLENMSTKIAGKQVNIEQRVTFKLDLPNKKIISVKSKPEKVLEEVLRPILYKYHYALDDVQVHLREAHAGRTSSPIIKMMVTDIDGRRLTILDKNEEPHKNTLHEITNRVFNEIMPEHQDGGNVSVKKLADYMNCRFAGQQMVEECVSRKESIDEDSRMKKPIIAKWTSGVKLQSPASVGSLLNAEVSTKSQAANYNDVPVPPRPREQLRAAENTFEVPGFLKNELSSERPTPAPRLSITRNTLQTSMSSINNSQDSGILSNRSVLSTGGSSQSENSMMSHHDPNELDNLKSPPPPLPPKPKVLPIRGGANWGGGGGQSTSYATGTSKNVYLDQSTSSFV